MEKRGEGISADVSERVKERGKEPWTVLPLPPPPALHPPSCRTLLLNKEPDANACKVLEDWISSLSFFVPFPVSVLFGPLLPLFFPFHGILFIPPHGLPPPSLLPHPLNLTVLLLLSTVLKLKMCRGLGFGSRVYFGAVIKFIAWDTRAHIHRHSHTHSHSHTHVHLVQGLVLQYIVVSCCITLKVSFICAAPQQPHHIL